MYPMLGREPVFSMSAPIRASRAGSLLQVLGASLLCFHALTSTGLSGLME